MKRLLWLACAIVVVLVVGLGAQKKSSGQGQSPYRDPVDEKIKVELKKVWSRAKSPCYILDKVDQQCFKNGEEDIRVLTVLKELTNKHRHILAVRVKSGYDTNGAISRESDPGWTNYSPHGRGRAQAFDIFYADKVDISWQVSDDPVKRKKAKDKIRQLMKQMLDIGLRKRDFSPTQLCVYEREDIMAFQKEAHQLYGGYPPQTGLLGMMSGDRYWDRIHVGF